MVALLKRLLYILPVIWLVVSMVFLLIHLVPGDPVQQMLGEGATASDLSALRHQYGLDAPLGRNMSITGAGCCTATWADPCGSTIRSRTWCSPAILTRWS